MLDYYVKQLVKKGYDRKAPHDFAKSFAVDENTEYSPWKVAKSIGAGELAYILDTFLNGNGGEGSGVEVGLLLRNTHRTLQRLAIVFAFGLLYGISKQQYSDPRNATALESAKKVAEMIDKEEIRFGAYL